MRSLRDPPRLYFRIFCYKVPVSTEIISEKFFCWKGKFTKAPFFRGRLPYLS